MAHFKTHYDNLKVSRHASASRIRSAYRKLAQKYHPDKFDGSPSEANRIMRILNDAKATLLDPLQRQAYDLRMADRERAEPSEPARAAPRRDADRSQEQWWAHQAELQRRARAADQRAAQAAATSPRARRSKANAGGRWRALRVGADASINWLGGALGGATRFLVRRASMAPLKTFGALAALIASFAFAAYLLSDPVVDLRQTPVQMAVAQVQVRAPYPNPRVELKPTAGFDLDRSPEQIRYCLSEDIRLKAIKNAVDSAAKFENDRLAAAVLDYNKLCHRYTYRPTTFETVKNDVAAHRLALVAEGLARLNAWRNLAPAHGETAKSGARVELPETLFPAIHLAPSMFAGEPPPDLDLPETQTPALLRPESSRPGY